jgi:uncharacterized membrane protein YkoI
MSVSWSLIPLLLGALFMAAPLGAQSPRYPPPAEFARPPARPAQGLEEAVNQVRERVGGRVLSAETQEGDGRPRHVIRILTPDGRVRRVQVDAASGRMLGGER